MTRKERIHDARTLAARKSGGFATSGRGDDGNTPEVAPRREPTASGGGAGDAPKFAQIYGWVRGAVINVAG